MKTNRSPHDNPAECVHLADMPIAKPRLNGANMSKSNGIWRDPESAPIALRAGLPFYAPRQVKSYFKPARSEGKRTGKSYFNPFETPTNLLIYFVDASPQVGIPQSGLTLSLKTWWAEQWTPRTK